MTLLRAVGLCQAPRLKTFATRDDPALIRLARRRRPPGRGLHRHGLAGAQRLLAPGFRRHPRARARGGPGPRLLAQRARAGARHPPQPHHRRDGGRHRRRLLRRDHPRGRGRCRTRRLHDVRVQRRPAHRDRDRPARGAQRLPGRGRDLRRERLSRRSSRRRPRGGGGARPRARHQRAGPRAARLRLPPHHGRQQGSGLRHHRLRAVAGAPPRGLHQRATRPVREPRSPRGISRSGDRRRGRRRPGLRGKLLLRAGLCGDAADARRSRAAGGDRRGQRRNRARRPGRPAPGAPRCARARVGGGDDRHAPRSLQRHDHGQRSRVSVRGGGGPAHRERRELSIGDPVAPPGGAPLHDARRRPRP